MSAELARRRPRADLPKGFRDYFGEEVLRRQRILNQIAEIYHAYGFEPLETPAVETVEALGKFLPDVDRPNEGVFAWKDDGEWLALRYDLTAPLARVAAHYRNALAFPFRRYAMGPVWRNEKPGPGRFRQFYQCDADTVGAPGAAADAEICLMLSEVFEALGLGTAHRIRVNSRKVLNGVLEAAGLFDPADPERDAEKRGIVLRAIDKLDRLGAEGVRALLGEGRRDESGDFTEGAKLSEAQIELVLAFTAARRQTAETTLSELCALVGGSKVGQSGIAELEEIAALAQALRPSAAIVIDPSVVRGLGYYTGAVFEAELTFEILDETGRPRQFGSVAGGGRYDDLVERFTGQKVPATGASIGVDRLLAALSAREAAQTEKATGPVVVTVMDRERMSDYLAMAAELRAAGIRAEGYLGTPRRFATQLKYADKRNAPVAVIQGSDERARGVVVLKDLRLGALIAAQASREEWRQRPAQHERPREALVQGVREILAAHAEMRG